MKLVIQIPCRNEEATLAHTLAELPRTVAGFDRIERIVIDDGSTDRSVEIALQCGVDEVVRLRRHQGLAAAFRAGLEACLRRGADVVVNTDADNQYRASDIPALVAPIVAGQADLVVGARRMEEIEDFSYVKKRMQRLGSWVVRLASGTKVPDATSGFRALSREAALRLNVFSQYTYTLETLIQAGQNNLVVVSVSIGTNPATRKSRLIRNPFSYVFASVLTIGRMFLLYRPLRSFGLLGGASLAAGFAIGIRFLWYWLIGKGGGHVQSLILASIVITIGFQILLLGVLADLISANRRLAEEIQYRLRKRELGAWDRAPERLAHDEAPRLEAGELRS